MKGYLKILEASEFLGVTAQTLRNWDNAGKLNPTATRMNNYRMYKKADLEKLLKRVRRNDARRDQIFPLCPEVLGRGGPAGRLHPVPN
jgi:DNA-binding transcriptional MerR regulator